MICLINVPYRLNLVSPLSLAILKSLLKDYETISLDFSPEFNRRILNIYLRKLELEKTSGVDVDVVIAWLTQRFPLHILERGPRNELDYKFLDVVNQIAKRILSYGPNIACFSTFSSNLPFALLVSKILKNEGTRIIIGGVAIHDKGQFFSKKYSWVDCFVEGEAEPVFADLVSKLHSGHEVPKTIISPLLWNLNDSPIPDYTDLDLNLYKMIGIETQRGCPNRCTFCANRFAPSYDVYREKTVKRVKEEVEHLSGYNKIFYFCDNITNPSKKRLLDLCKSLLPLSIRWRGEMLPNISFREAKLMAESGCVCVALGCESLSDKVLKDMKKPVTYERIKETLQNLHMNRIRAIVMLIKNFPTETCIDTMKTSLRLFLLRRHIESLVMSDFRVVPNSIIYNNPKKFGIHLQKIENSPYFVAPFSKISPSTEFLKLKLYYALQTFFTMYKEGA